MKKISLDRTTQTLVVQAGALNGELLDILKTEDLMLPIGTCPQVGVCGLTLGGGIGENSRWAGMTSDRLRSTNIVLANGTMVTANDRSYSDLFWACRGAGGDNFGIHTELTFELLPLVSPVTSAIWLIYEGAHAAIDVFHAVDISCRRPRIHLTASFF
jgi:FAD/FMN-containing dehydrogenase